MKRDGECYVYYIRCGESGPIKIGVSSNPLHRLDCLQTSHFEKLRLIARFIGDEFEERFLHDRYKEHRLQREWFEPADQILGEIGGDIRATYGPAGVEFSQVQISDMAWQPPTDDFIKLRDAA